MSIVFEPQGALTYRSSTLTFLDDYGSFRGLLLTILGSRSDFHDRRTPVGLCGGHHHSQFSSILAGFMDYYSPFWGPKAIFMDVEPQGALTYRSSTIAVSADSGPFLGLLLSFGVT